MQSRAFVFLFITVFVTILGFGLIFPLLPFLAKKFAADPFTISLLLSAFPLMQFTFAPLWGRLSDRWGRKPLICLSLLGTTLAFFLFPLGPNLFWLFLVRLLHGILSSASLPVSFAAVADLTTKKERAFGMGILGSAFGLGFAAGPALGGILSQISFAAPFFASSAISFLNFFFVLGFLPETLKEKSKEKIAKRDLFNLVKIYEGLRGEMRVLFILLFFNTFSFAIFGVAYPLWTLEKFGFGPSENGYIFALTGLLQAGIQALLIGPLNQKIGGHRVLNLGFFLMPLGLFFLPQANRVIASIFFLSLMTAGNALNGPTLNSLISRETKEGQGTTLGMGTAFESFGRTVGPVLVGWMAEKGSLENAFFLVTIFLSFAFFVSLKISHPEKG